MKTYKFKTNINCGTCVANVTPHMNGEGSIESWEVDTTNPDKVLTVSGENLTKEQVKETVEKAGYLIQGEL